MAEIKKIRRGNDIAMPVRLKTGEGEVASIDITTIKKLMVYNDEQKVSIEVEKSLQDEELVAIFRAEKQHYLGTYRLVVVYNDGATATWDKPAVELVATTAEADEDTQGLVIVEISGELQVMSLTEVQKKIDKILEVSARPAYIGENNHWFTFDTDAGEYVDSGVRAVGPEGPPGPSYDDTELRVLVDGKADKADTLEGYGITDAKITANTSGIFVQLGKTNAKIPSKTSDLTNDSGFLTQHQDISGKADKTYVDTELAKKATTSQVTALDTKVNTGVSAAASAASTAESAATSAATSAAAADSKYRDILAAMQSLPDGSAVSAQVAVNTGKLSELEGKVDDLDTELGKHYEDSGVLLSPIATKTGVYPRIDIKTYGTGTTNNSGVFDVSSTRYLHVKWNGINVTYFGIALTDNTDVLTDALWISYPSASGEMDIDTLGHRYAVICVDYNGAFRGSLSERKAIDIKNKDSILELERMKLPVKFGKNLFNKETAVIGYYFNNANGGLGTNGSYYISDYIPVKSGNSYHISTANDTALGFANAFMIAYDINKAVIEGAPVSNTNYTTPQNAAYLRLSIYYTRIEYAQVEAGNVRTTYEPFSAVKGYANELSPRPFDGKKFYSIGDSIAYQEQWQGTLANMRGLNYITAATKSLTNPLGIGGSTICPRIQVQTTPNALPAKYTDGTPVKDFDGNALYFLEGRGVGQSIFIRAAWFANVYSDAEVVVINGGQNDEKAFSYNSAGAPSDLPYEGKEYVVAKYANIAKAYGGTSHTIAILNDGSATLPSEFLNGDYTILTEAPTFASCLAGVIKRICVGVPTAMVVGNSLLPSNMPLTSQTGGRTERADMMSKVYRQNRIPFANMYDGLGVNEYNFSHYFIDNYHPNGEGGLRMAAILSHIL